MDESWDAEFEGDIRIPDSIRGTSKSIRSETSAARELSRVTAQLRAELLNQSDYIPKPLLLRAMAIVRASTTNDIDDIYRSDAWEHCKNEDLAVAGDSIEEVLTAAMGIRDEILAIPGRHQPNKTT